jgi:hypothetical protein
MDWEVVGTEKRGEVCDDGDIDRSGNCGVFRVCKFGGRDISGMVRVSAVAAPHKKW